MLDIPSSDSSVDLDESFETLLQERRRKIQAEAEKLAPKTPATSKHEPYRPLKTPATNELEETMSDEQSVWMKCSDETFLNMEQMCENTTMVEDAEVNAIDRLINECGGNGRRPGPSRGFTKGFADMTQLNDVEAPSMMWEQTIVHANSPKPSPVKMVCSCFV